MLGWIRAGDERMAEDTSPDKPNDKDEGTPVAEPGDAPKAEKPNGEPDKAKTAWTTGKSVVTLAAMIAFVVVAYLAYDLLRGQVNACETIFEQSRTSIQANLEIIQQKGTVAIGPTKVQDLSERAMATAVTLKACCIKLETDGFLQCQANVTRFEDRLAQAAATAEKAATAEASGSAAEKATTRQAVVREVNAASQQSQVVQEQFAAIARVKPAATVKPAQAAFETTDTAEIEPNDETWEANLIPLGAWIEAAIPDASDTDTFRFRTPPVHRDRIRIAIENRSNSLKPWFRVLDNDKNQLFDIPGYDEPTAGANVERTLISGPDTDYYLQIGKFGNTTGQYAFRVEAMKRYDAYEPNDSARDATPIDPNVAIEANIMDAGDNDYYAFSTGDTAGRARIVVENLSESLIPWFRILDGTRNKVYEVPGYEEPSAGADLTRTLEVAANGTYYVHVGKFEKTAGDYRLTVVLD